MPTKYYPFSTNVSGTCDSGVGSDHDMFDTAPGGSTSHNDTNPGGSYVEVRSYIVDVSGDSPVTGSQTYNCSVDVTVLSKCDIRFRIRAIDTTGCGRTNSSGYQEYLVGTGTGIKTFSLTLDFTSSDELLEFVTEIRDEAGSHGTKQATVSVDDNDTWVEAPWPVAGTVQQGGPVVHG